MTVDQNPIPFDWRAEIESSLAKNYQSVTGVSFESGQLKLFFQPGTPTQVKRQAMVHVTELLSQMAEKNLLPLPPHDEYVN